MEGEAIHRFLPGQHDHQDQRDLWAALPARRAPKAPFSRRAKTPKRRLCIQPIPKDQLFLHQWVPDPKLAEGKSRVREVPWAHGERNLLETQERNFLWEADPLAVAAGILAMEGSPKQRVNQERACNWERQLASPAEWWCPEDQGGIRSPHRPEFRADPWNGEASPDEQRLRCHIRCCVVKVALSEDLVQPESSSESLWGASCYVKVWIWMQGHLPGH